MPAGQVELWVRALSPVIGDHFLALSSHGGRGLGGRLVLPLLLRALIPPWAPSLHVLVPPRRPCLLIPSHWG